MSAPKTRKKSNTFVWAILGLLVVSLTGFGVREIGNSGAAAVGTVGAEKVTVNSYSRALTNQMRNLSQQFGTALTFEQAQAFGIDRMVLAQVLNQAALDNETGRIGLSVGDTLVKKNLLATPGFQGLTGGFDQAAYKEALRRANLSASEYDRIIRKDTARSLLQVSIAGGVKPADTYALALYAYIGETRNLRWALIDESLLPEPTRAPTEIEIEEQYKADPVAYTAPETRKITYASITPESLVDTIAVDDQALKELYESQPERFNIPARRIVDRLIMPNEAAAKTAFDALLDGSKTFDDLVTDRGLTLNDVDLGEVTQKDLSGAAGDAVFLLVEPGFAGPIETDLGPAIFRVNAVLDAQETPFKEAKAELHGEYVADRARRQIDDSILHIDDLLAGGATLEDLAAQTDMKLGSIDFTETSEDGIAAHEEFRTAAAQAVQGDFPKVITLEDGGIFALRLDSTIAPTLRPLAEVKDQVALDWQAGETHKRLLAIADYAKAQLEAGEDFVAIALKPIDEPNAQRQSVIENAPAKMIEDAFKLTAGQVSVVADATTVAIVKVVAITPYDDKNAKNRADIDTLSGQVGNQIGNDIYAAFSRAVQEQAGVTINQSVINAVHTQIR